MASSGRGVLGWRAAWWCELAWRPGGVSGAGGGDQAVGAVAVALAWLTSSRRRRGRADGSVTAATAASGRR